MVFSSHLFLFYFLPLFFAAYFAAPGITAKNAVLLAASLVFYAWGEPWFVAVLVGQTLFNYAMALAIDARNGTPRRSATAVGVAINLLLLGLFINAPLEELANPNVTPAVAKAPWYFLGLQELLAYFHPTVAGALTPAAVLVGSALIPYLDRRNIHSTKPSDRKLEVTLFSVLWALGLTVTCIGIFFRGPGYSFILPWSTGFFFSL